MSRSTAVLHTAQCGGKTRYDSRADAEAEQAAQRRRYRNVVTLYQCPWEESGVHFHLTRQAIRRKR